MKREAGDGPQGGGPQKRYRGGDGNEIRLLIPSKVRKAQIILTKL